MSTYMSNIDRLFAGALLVTVVWYVSAIIEMI